VLFCFLLGLAYYILRFYIWPMIGLLRFRVILALTLTTNHNYRHFTPARWITSRTHGPCAFIITTFSRSHVNEEVSCMPINIYIFLGGCCCRDSTTIWRTMIGIIAAEVLAFGLQLQVTAAHDAFASPTEVWGNGLQTYKPPIGPSNLI
jgi:hypothetical protein